MFSGMFGWGRIIFEHPNNVSKRKEEGSNKYITRRLTWSNCHLEVHLAWDCCWEETNSWRWSGSIEGLGGRHPPTFGKLLRVLRYSWIESMMRGEELEETHFCCWRVLAIFSRDAEFAMLFMIIWSISWIVVKVQAGKVIDIPSPEDAFELLESLCWSSTSSSSTSGSRPWIWQILSQIAAHPDFSWKLRAKSHVSDSDQTISVPCCRW